MHKTCLLDTKESRYLRLAVKITSKLNSLFNLPLFSIDIKKCSLSILKSLVLSRDDAKTELLENGVLDQCLSYV